MRTLIFFICITLSHLAHAESHGGVMRANAQFQAVTKYALGEGADIDRVFGIKKVIHCPSETGSVFQIQFGSQNSETGNESYGETRLVLASEPEGGMADPGTVRISPYHGSCK